MENEIKNPHPECLLRDIRNQREPLLVEADYLVNHAVDTGGNVVAVRAYRQALRDITTTFAGRLDEVVWPQKP